MRRATQSLFIAGLLGAGCSTGPGTDESLPPGASGIAGSMSPTSGAPSGQAGSSATPINTAGPVGTDTSPNGTLPATSSSAPDVLLPPGDCVKGIPITSQVPRMTPLQYDGALRDILKVTDVGGKSPSAALGIGENKGAMTSTEWNAYQNVAAEIAKAVMAGANKAEYIACDPAMAGCLEDTVKTFGLKMFRRPLVAEEVASFMEFDALTPKGTPAEVAEAILYAFLVSPSFIMTPELSEEKDASGSYKLSQYEIATRLSTLIWRSVPDSTLLTAAENNELGTSQQILAQAERMIAVKEKSAPLLADYHRFFADINSSSHWNRTEHDPSKFPAGVSREAFSETMMAEVDSFFAEVAGGGTFKDLFLSPVAYVNKNNAAVYGLDPAMYGDTLTRVELDPAQRPGYLTRAGFLSSYSGFTKTSPILRGAYIGQKLLGSPAVAAKPGVPSEPPPGDYMTRREEVDALTAPDDCKACHHTAINPPGYVMEMFDSMGAIQTKDPLGGDINTVADVTVDGTPRTINNPLELMQAIANGTSGQRMYATRWVEYATGRTPNANDACSVDAIAMKLSADGTYTIVKLLADLSQTEPFNLRVAGN